MAGTAERLPDVKFTAARSKCDNCLCTACHGDNYVTKIEYPVTLYHDRRNLTTKYKPLWLCDECMRKMLTAIRESRRDPEADKRLEECGFEL
jgi:hypothetical protein